MTGIYTDNQDMNLKKRLKIKQKNLSKNSLIFVKYVSICVRKNNIARN